MSGYSPAQTIINRVLLVEADPEAASALTALLEKRRMHVEVARDGGQARTSFTMHQPDFVILELVLPNVTGFEVCEQLKRLNENVPTLILTEVDMDDARDLARRVGADGYMTKPYDPDELLSRILYLAEEAWARTHLNEGDQGDERVRFECTECGKHLRVKAQHRGRTLNCPRCGRAVVVPRHT